MPPRGQAPPGTIVPLIPGDMAGRSPAQLVFIRPLAQLTCENIFLCLLPLKPHPAEDVERNRWPFFTAAVSRSTRSSVLPLSSHCRENMWLLGLTWPHLLLVQESVPRLWKQNILFSMIVKMWASESPRTRISWNHPVSFPFYFSINK